MAVPLPWWMVAFKQDDKTVIVWDGERSVHVDHRRDIPSAATELERLRASERRQQARPPTHG